MGQRLCIEILDNGAPLANAYYHWSGYTQSAAELLEEILSSTRTLNDTFLPKIYDAIKLLVETGAGLEQDDYDAINELVAEKVLPPLPKELNVSAKDRNEGLICISDEGMEDTRVYAEGFVNIDITKKIVSFDVWGYVDDELADELDLDKNYTKQKIPFNFDSMTYGQALDLCRLLISSDYDTYYYETPNGDRYICIA